jgi:transcription antitermination factor NusG
MRKNLFLSAVFIFIGIFGTSLSAQTNADVGIKPNFAGGEVTSIADGKIVLQTKDGALELVLSDKTEYKRVPPENPSLKAAVAASLTDIGVGDKLLVTGMVSEDKKTIPAKAVYLITKADIAQKQTKEQTEWQTRGVVGKVKSFNPMTKIIVVSVRSLMGEKEIQVSPKEAAEFYRYAPDSVKFSEAKKSSMNEIEIGDSLRALGDKNADGSEVKAEKIITGAFKTVGGTITAIDAEKNEITINDFQTKKPVTIVVSDSSILKQFPAEMANRMAQFQAGGGGQGGFRPPTQGNTPTTTPQQKPPTQGQTPNGQGGGGFRGGGGGIDEMLERFPTVKVADLKVGEMIAVSSTKSADPSRIKAIKLLSGVEPFIKMQQMATAGQGGGNRGGGANSGFTIPGLDGFGAP